MKSLIAKKTYLLLTIVLLLTFCACGTSSGNTENSISVSEPVEVEIEEECKHIFDNGICTVCGEQCPHTFENGTCTICGVKAIDILAGFLKDSPDSFSKGAYIKSFLHMSFGDVSTESTPDAVYSLGFAYVEESKTLIIQGMKDPKGASETLTISINGGVVAKRYEYGYSYVNLYVPFTDSIYGSFDASTLSTTESFNYTSKSAGSADILFKEWVIRYQEDACILAKETISMLDELLDYYELGIRSSDLNFG